MFECKRAGRELSGIRRFFDWLPSDGTLNFYQGGLMPVKVMLSERFIMNRHRQGDDNA
jgi:hypothetical protein